MKYARILVGLLGLLIALSSSYGIYCFVSGPYQGTTDGLIVLIFGVGGIFGIGMMFMAIFGDWRSGE